MNPEDVRQKGRNGKSFLDHVERWLPAMAAVAAVLGVLLVGWTQGERIASLEGNVSAIRGELDRRTQLEAALRTEVQTFQAYVVVLTRTMTEAGLDPHQLPGTPGN